MCYKDMKPEAVSLQSPDFKIIGHGLSAVQCYAKLKRSAPGMNQKVSVVMSQTARRQTMKLTQQRHISQV